MSNVLIGIIGVILFIGLALAGALILGSDFASASSASQGAAVMSQIKQAADAADMYRLKTGKAHLPSSDTAFLVPRFLKTKAVNATSFGADTAGQYAFSVHLSDQLYAYSSPDPSYAAKYLFAAIGYDTDQKARNTCQSIGETYGVATIPDYGNNFDPHPAADIGCILGVVFRSGDPGPRKVYIAYQRVAPASQSRRVVD